MNRRTRRAVPADPDAPFGNEKIDRRDDGDLVRFAGVCRRPRVVDACARRLPVQERLTREIRDCIHATRRPRGVAAMMKAQSVCMLMRGAHNRQSCATTSAFTGEFEQDRTRAEFMRLIPG